MKYALIENNIVKQISYQSVDGWEQVSDNVFAEMIKKPDGTFDLTDEVKQQIANVEQEKLDKEQAKQSAIDKLKALGLTDAEIEAFRGN